MTAKKTRIQLVDDHLYLSESVKTYLEDRHPDEFIVVALSTDGVAAVEDVHRSRPDIVLLDIQLPRASGLNTLREIKKQNPAPLVLILSAVDEESTVVEALRAGADDYLFKKNATPKILVEHFRRALRKSRAPTVPRTLKPSRSFPSLRAPSPTPHLTGMELEILKLSAYRGFSAREITDELSQGRMSIRTIATHWQHIYEKLGVHSQAQAVYEALKLGLLPPQADSSS